MLPRFVLAMVLAAAAAIGLSGCGVRGNLDAPPSDIKSESSDAGPSKPREEPKKGFVLDPLLR